jgi:hypothetical protein
MNRIKGKLLQSQDFKSEIVRDLEEHEARLREVENDKNKVERELRSTIDTKNQIIKEKTQRI